MRRIVPVAALALALAGIPGAVAQAPGAPGAPERSRVTAGSYAADPGHTMVVWQVDHFGFSNYSGMFGDVTGTLALDPANPSAAKVVVTIPVAKVTTPSAALTAHLLREGKDGGSPDFFGANPADARFVSTSVEIDSNGDAARVVGNLTLNGVTRPVTLNTRFHGAGVGMMKKETVGFEAEASIKRSDFGIAFAVPLVSDEVKLRIHAAFEKQ